MQQSSNTPPSKGPVYMRVTAVTRLCPKPVDEALEAGHLLLFRFVLDLQSPGTTAKNVNVPDKPAGKIETTNGNVNI